jgi:hypothetical protein
MSAWVPECVAAKVDGDINTISTIYIYIQYRYFCVTQQYIYIYIHHELKVHRSLSGLQLFVAIYLGP